MTTITYLGLGSNIGDRDSFLLFAREQIQAQAGCISAVSGIIESVAWGFDSENKFLNQVIELQTSLSPEELLFVCKTIEKAAGRTEKSTADYLDRVLDIDILYYGNWLANSVDLQIPHPHIAARRFVLEPLYEIAPDFIDPASEKSVREMFLEKFG